MSFFLFTAAATAEIYTLSLHDALPIWAAAQALSGGVFAYVPKPFDFKQLDHLVALALATPQPATGGQPRSEEHTSELQSLTNLVCRLLLEKKKKNSLHFASQLPGHNGR